MNNLYNFFENAYNEDKLVQSYLIGNTKFDDIKEELYKVFNTFFFKNNISIEENPDVYILKTDNGEISKDDIKELIKNVNYTSQFHDIKIYVIDESEKLNVKACNALLKTLEEPGPNVYAFLITENIDSVLPTIASRCQKVFISSEVKVHDFDEQVNIISIELVNLIESENIKTIARHPEIYNKITDRDMFKEILLCIQNKYIERMNTIISNDVNDPKLELMSKQILVINNCINLLENYLNKNLTIDRFIIEMWRCNNENN